jgi:hypothetical protein
MVLKLAGVQALKHKAADGRIKIYYRDRKSGLALGNSDNERAVLDRHAALSAGRKGPAARVRAAGSYAEAIQRYRASAEWAALAPRTQELWGTALRRLETIWGHFPTTEISKTVVSAAKNGFIKKHGPTGAKNLYVTGRAVWNWFRQFGATAAPNPFAEPGKFATHKQQIAKRKRKKDDLWRIDQIRALLDSARQVNAGGNPNLLDELVIKQRPLPDDIRLAVLLGFFTCQRQTDLLNLRATQIEQRGDQLWLHITQHKTGADVSLPLHRLVVDELKRQQIDLDTDTLLLRAPKTNGRFRREGFYRRFALWTHAAGLTLTFQALRRSGMIALAELGETVPRIAAVSGHSIAQTSKILDEYLSPTEQMAADAIERWNRSIPAPRGSPRPRAKSKKRKTSNR